MKNQTNKGVQGTNNPVMASKKTVRQFKRTLNYLKKIRVIKDFKFEPKFEGSTDIICKVVPVIQVKEIEVSFTVQNLNDEE